MLVAAMCSDPGRVRRKNEDACALAPELGAYVVCDGMGGAAGGGIASRLAVSTFLGYLADRHPNQPQDRLPPASGHPRSRPQTRLEGALQAANRAVYQHALAHSELAGMGTTLVALLHLAAAPHDRRARPRPATSRFPPRFVSPPDLFLLNVGDSRCYRLRDGHLVQLSTDHSFVEEQVRAGQITAEQAADSPMRSYITRAVGPASRVQPDLERYRTRPGDLYLLCSDGLSRELTTEQIADVLTSSPTSQPPVTADLDLLLTRLVAAANHNGGHDNITAILLACP